MILVIWCSSISMTSNKKHVHQTTKQERLVTLWVLIKQSTRVSSILTKEKRAKLKLSSPIDLAVFSRSNKTGLDEQYGALSSYPLHSWDFHVPPVIWVFHLVPKKHWIRHWPISIHTCRKCWLTKLTNIHTREQMSGRQRMCVDLTRSPTLTLSGIDPVGLHYTFS